MRTPKIVETFIASLNELLTNGQLTLVEEPTALKSLNHILGALVPGYSILTMHDIDGRLAGFAPKFTSTTTSCETNTTDTVVSYPE
jgi:hypothetical protein